MIVFYIQNDIFWQIIPLFYVFPTPNQRFMVFKLADKMLSGKQIMNKYIYPLEMKRLLFSHNPAVQRWKKVIGQSDGSGIKFTPASYVIERRTTVVLRA